MEEIKKKKMYLNLKDRIDYKKLEETAEIIKNGGVVVFPTETVYGIGTNGLDEIAIKKLYDIKRRPLNKPISLLVSNIEMIDQVAKNITEKEYKLIKKFFPGPITIVLNKKENVPNILTSNGSTVGVRMPKNEIALKLIDLVGVPIATSSANISGEESGIDFDNVMRKFSNKVDCLIDGGASNIGIGSTVVQIINEEPIILRKGIISKEELFSVIKD